jgi:DNA-binding transcriptional LysR family regulator
MDKLECIRTFVRVAQSGSLTNAANQLGISRSMVTKQLKFLEDGLGVRLLHRTTRALSLTDIGETYLERCTHVLDDLDDAEQQATNATIIPRGTLNVAAPPSYGVLHVAPAVAEFIRRYPDVDVSLTLSDHTLDMAGQGIDVALRLGEMQDSGLIAHTLSHVRTLVCGAPDYFKRHGRPLHPNDLLKHNCLRWRSGPFHQDVWQFKSGKETIEVVVTGNLESNVADVPRAAAREGLGLILQAAYMVSNELRSGQLEAVLSDYATPSIAVHVVYLNRRHLPAKVRSFVEFLKERFEGKTYLDD